MGRPRKVYTQEELLQKQEQHRERCRRYRASEKGREASRRSYEAHKTRHGPTLSPQFLEWVKQNLTQAGIQQLGDLSGHPQPEMHQLTQQERT